MTLQELVKLMAAYRERNPVVRGRGVDLLYLVTHDNGELTLHIDLDISTKGWLMKSVFDPENAQEYELLYNLKSEEELRAVLEGKQEADWRYPDELTA